MKKYFNLLVIGAACLSLNQADAAAKKLMNNPGVSEDPYTIKCSRTYCAKVELSTQVNDKGYLQVYKKNETTKIYEKTDIGCKAIGGNPAVWTDQAIFTPKGVFGVYKRTPLLDYSPTGKRADRKPSPAYKKASYFYNPGAPSGNEVAIHTADDREGINKNSHGCVRAQCAPSVYALNDLEVQVDYVR